MTLSKTDTAQNKRLDALEAVVKVQQTRLDKLDPPTPPPPPAPTGTFFRRDDCTNPDPRALWGPADNPDGAYDIEGTGSFEHFTSGGPNNGPFRRAHVNNKRTELGYNTWKGNGDAPPATDPAKRAAGIRTFWNYVEGDHAVTEWWLRLPSDFPLDTTSWQNVLQMKQAGPYPGEQGFPGSPSSLPVLHFEARRNALEVSVYDTAGGAAVLSCPLAKGVWVPIKVEATYSSDPTKGRLQLTVSGIQTAAKNMRTLDNNAVTAFPGWQPSHVRLGLYHDQSLPATYADYADIRISG